MPLDEIFKGKISKDDLDKNSKFQQLKDKAANAKLPSETQAYIDKASENGLIDPEQQAMLTELKTKVESFETSKLLGISKQLAQVGMSDSQMLKMIVRNKYPNLTDRELNLLVYGEDLKKKYGAKYKEFKTEREEEKELDLQKPPKTKKEKRQKDKKLFKPISKDHPLYDEVTKVKTEFKNKLNKLEREGIELGKEIVKFGILIGTTISASIVIMAPPSFNIPGGITLILSLINAFSELQRKINDFLPLMDVVRLIPLVIPPDKMGKTLPKIVKIFETIRTISQTVNSLASLLPSMSEAKQAALEKIQTQIDDCDAKIDALDSSADDYESKKEELEDRKALLGKQAEKLLK